MRKALMLAAASAIVLSACQPASEEKAADAAATDAAAAADAATDASAAADAAPAHPGEASSPSLRSVPIAPPAPIAQIAYAFNYVMSVPKDRGAELMSRHEYACISAGPGYCQVVTAQADWTSRDPGGRLELRGQPEWINRFRSTLALDASNAGGRLEEAATNGEDVTREIDHAETGAKTTASLAERMRELQARRGGTMKQRLEVERELADLRRQLDAQQVQLRELNDRVQTALLTLDYREGGVMGADSPTRPVARALSDAFGLSMGMLALLITAGSVMLPVAVIGGAVWWATIRRRRKPAAT
ncbi:DUF4349 domain-containing protein [Brevundimonas lenta]|uniref:DUF4349 domain-containing protein n=1 Tax=Brevundimonas lenta TaxID=424796 RepID=A0A7W6JC65_9CAUL|nr:DUF4349 domain-containing protein [Brevundimonas lenta]MBB4082435.1 hypothetical protein [Brevundimonas lenta]